MTDSFKYLIYGAICATSILSGASCSVDTTEERTGSALLVPSVSIDPSVITVNGVSSLTGITPLPSPADMSLRLTAGDGLYSKTWATLAEYPLREPYRPGAYRMEAFYGDIDSEGFDSPYIYGSANISLVSGGTLETEVTCSLANTALHIDFTPEFTGYFSDASAILHSAGGGYICYPTAETRYAFVRPGQITLNLDITMPDGRHASFMAAKIDRALAGHLYNATISLNAAAADSPEITVSFDELSQADDVVIRLTPEFLASKAPEVEAVGFRSDEPVTFDEGSRPAEAVSFCISGADASSLLLSTNAPSLEALGWPEEIDLVSAPQSQLSQLETMGLRLSRTGGRITDVDLTGVMPRLRFSSDSQLSTFSLTAIGPSGKLDGPVTLAVSLRPVDISVVSATDIIMGVNMAQLKILAGGDDLQSNLAIEILDARGHWKAVPIESITPCEGSQHEYLVNVAVDPAGAESVEMRVIYCGQIKTRTTLKAVQPDYSVTVDPFALLAIVKIDAADPALLEAITSLINVYVDGEQPLMFVRQPARGYVIVGGLESGRRYTLTTTLFNRADAGSHMSPAIVFTTEKASQIPNGDFEEIRSEAVKYDRMPSGGRYSQSIVDIFNQQNYTSFHLSVPRRWANTNAKTFCMAASNKNTWYMQPSVYTVKDCTEGAYAVTIRSCAWDIHGEPIPDYRQESMPFVGYSRNIPRIAHRAAGKLLLGDYSFDPSTMTERYESGIPFESRPAALNGFYKFIPTVDDLSDCGIVSVEVIGDNNGADIVIASGTARLTSATSYTAFSVPLEYIDFGIKATRLNILFSSSCHIGSIETESAEIVTFSNPVTSTSIGGELTVDGLTLSY